MKFGAVPGWPFLSNRFINIIDLEFPESVYKMMEQETETGLWNEEKHAHLLLAALDSATCKGFFSY